MSDEGRPRVRFAPSPTGSLHVGNARTALFNWLVARQQGGTLVLRIEDTDAERHQQGSEEQILEDLRWLGLDWDEGPDIGGPRGPYRQSERGPTYAAEARRLLEAARAYRCFCSDDELTGERQRQRDAGMPPRYSRRCRALSRDEADRRAEAGEAFALRFATPDDLGDGGRVAFNDRLRGRLEFDLAELGDLVIVRRDGRPTYNFAVVVDDAAMGIDKVLRGDDHLSNTPRQVLIFDALGYPRPEFTHLPTVRGLDGARLSKRHGAASVSEYRQAGFSAQGMCNALVLLGWSPSAERTLLTLDEMLQEFDLGRVNRAPAAFDPDRLDWISGQHLRRLPAEDLAREVALRLAASDRLPARSGEQDREFLLGLAEMVRPGLDRFDQVDDRARALFAGGGAPADEDARQVLRQDGARQVVDALGRLADEDPPENAEGWRRLRDRVKEESGQKGKKLFHPIRVALTGETSGPELDQLIPLIVRGNRSFPDHVRSVGDRARRTSQGLD